MLVPVLRELNSTHPEVRESAIDVAVTILKAKNDAASRAQVMTMIHTGIADSSPAVRYRTLSVIDNLSSDRRFAAELQELISILQDVAQHDPYISSNGVYGMRNVAQKALNKIAKH